MFCWLGDFSSFTRTGERARVQPGGVIRRGVRNLLWIHIDHLSALDKISYIHKYQAITNVKCWVCLFIETGLAMRLNVSALSSLDVCWTTGTLLVSWITAQRESCPGRDLTPINNVKHIFINIEKFKDLQFNCKFIENYNLLF